MEFIRISDFDVLKRTGSAPEKALVIFHGFGASASDLAPLANVFPEFAPYTWYFVDGPLEVPLGMGISGKAWFPLDMEGLQQAMITGSFDSFFRSYPAPGLEEMVNKLKPLIFQLKNQHSQIVLGGFSQGSMIATHLYPLVRDWVQKLLLFSSSLVDEKCMNERYQENEELQILQTHGLGDPVLPFTGAKALNEFFTKKNLNHEFVKFQGGHEIPIQVLEKTKTFLEA